tara:strand:+ start:251 stop:529 length:279 start_codon:yes stop_codon:yes gene_type:complete
MFTNYSGTITIGGLPIADGVEIHARVGWYQSRSVKTYEGEYRSITVAPNDWALDLYKVTFHIGNAQAEETGIYNGRTFGSETINLTFPSLDD